MAYTAECAALSVLEVRVHLDLTWNLLPTDFVLMEIDTSIAAIEDATNVSNEIAHGDDWLASLRTPLLRVRSVIIPESGNVLINPAHPDSNALSVTSIRSFAFDARLWLPKS